jgi:hypothetical protein
VRAVILRGHDLLMVHSANVGDYKFPGGGVDGKLGTVVEYDFAEEKDFDVFKMKSYYYFCRVGGMASAHKTWITKKGIWDSNRHGLISIGQL